MDNKWRAVVAKLFDTAYANVERQCMLKWAADVVDSQEKLANISVVRKCASITRLLIGDAPLRKGVSALKKDEGVPLAVRNHISFEWKRLMSEFGFEVDSLTCISSENRHALLTRIKSMSWEEVFGPANVLWTERLRSRLFRDVACLPFMGINCTRLFVQIVPEPYGLAPIAPLSAVFRDMCQKMLDTFGVVRTNELVKRAIPLRKELIDAAKRPTWDFSAFLYEKLEEHLPDVRKWPSDAMVKITTTGHEGLWTHKKLSPLTAEEINAFCKAMESTDPNKLSFMNKFIREWANKAWKMYQIRKELDIYRVLGALRTVVEELRRLGRSDLADTRIEEPRPEKAIGEYNEYENRLSEHVQKFLLFVLTNGTEKTMFSADEAVGLFRNKLPNIKTSWFSDAPKLFAEKDYSTIVDWVTHMNLEVREDTVRINYGYEITKTFNKWAQDINIETELADLKVVGIDARSVNATLSRLKKDKPVQINTTNLHLFTTSLFDSLYFVCSVAGST